MTKIRFPLALAAVALATTAMAQQQTLPADHNGSAMRIERDGSRIRISYEVPRPGLAQAGVMTGMTVFEGTIAGDNLTGKAFAFKRGCAPAGYDVTGRIEGDRLNLAGPGPKRSGCNVIALDPASPHSMLAFTGKGGTVAALGEDASRPRTGIEMRAAISPTPPPVAAQPVQPEPAKAVPNVPSLPVTAPAPVPMETAPSAAVPTPRAEPVEVARPVTPPVQQPNPVTVESPRATPTPLPTPSKPVPVEAPVKVVKPKLDADL